MERRGGSFFGRRKGKTLRPAQREAVRTALPALLLDVTQPPPEQLAELFQADVGDIFLEIGFGGGEHLIHEAKRLPDVGFIGVEPFQNGLAKAVAVIQRDEINNVRVFNQDAVMLLDWLPPGSLKRVDLFYPDPWPKLRHWKRRFVNAENLARIERCLAADGVFRFASDIDAYVKWTLREVTRSGMLVWREETMGACRSPWRDWPSTRYEAKAIAEGRTPTYLTFRKALDDVAPG